MRILKKEIVVAAPLAAVWRAWTTTEGVTSFAPPKADIELRVGGSYEWYFQPDAPEGSRGSEGCKVLSYLPMKMLSFSWNAPPSIPELRDAGVKTHVVVALSELGGGRVNVTLSQLGFGEGEPWDRYYSYFDKAWPWVLAELQKRFGPSASPSPTDARE